MKRLLAIMAMAFAAVQFDAFAEPTVSDVVAKQRYPWNGLVDITCNVSGMDETTKLQDFAVAAVVPDTGETRSVSHFWVMRDGAKSTDYEVNSNGDYKLLWDAKADLGEVAYSNMVVRVTTQAVHDKVQLWENGPYWATTNIGAEEPEDYGYYFWWGDTVGYKRENEKWVASDGSSSNFSFDESNTPTYYKSVATLQSEGWITAEGVLAPKHDAAHVHWGGDWRMPTEQEFDDLNSNCDWFWTTMNGVNGYIVRGKGDYADNSIFLPCAGDGYETSLYNTGSDGYYWSSVPFSDDGYAWILFFYSGSLYTNTDRRYFGQSVRPVQGFTGQGNPTYTEDDISGDSAPFVLDTREERAIELSIVLPYDAAWISGDENATVVIDDNGVEIARKTDAGEFEYQLTGPCKHTLTYKTLINDDEQEETYTATVFKGWAYEVDDDGDAILVDTAYKSGDVVIPSEIDGYTVIGIADGVFAGCDGITSATIPGNLLSSISELFPDSYDKITSITLTGVITEIPARAFHGCCSITGFTVPETVTSIGECAFEGCEALMSVTIPDSVKSIGARAFDGCNIPGRNDGYKVIDGWVIGFSDNAQFKISNVDSIRGVADGALESCIALKELSFTQDSVLKAIGVAAFKGCTELKTMMLPPSLEEIGNEAFMSCSYLGNVIMPSGVKHVGDRAFKNCTGFTAAQIAYGVESLGEEAFYGDWRISEVDIPSTVTNIGVNAFGGDSSIIRIGLRGDVRKASEIFSNYRSIREATVKEGDGEIVDGLFSGFSSLQDVHFLGDCPALANDGQLLYMNTPDKTVDYGGGNVINALVTYVEQNSTGWDGTPGSHSLPQAWPLTGSYRRSIAWWDSPTYLCQFDSNGGTLGVQDTYQYSEKTISLPPEPVQTGYTFAGWWTQPVGGLRVTADTIFIEGVYTRLYAHWIKGHWVFLDPNGGTVVNDFVTYVEQSVYGVLPTPVKSGYAFGGWLYNGYKIEPETEINEKADHTLVAQWTANLYSVRYNANGGDGEMEDQGFVYGVEQELRKNLFARSGYEFIGWATNAVDAVGLEEETDAVVYADCESVTNLTAVADGWIELFAVWKESDVLPDPSNLDFHFSGDAKWELRYEGVAVEKDGETLRYATVWRSGSIANNQKSVLVANVYGAGKIGFWWKVSCESFRDWKLDNLEFAIDGVAQVPWINGEKDWAYVEFEVETSGAHTLTWAYSKDEEGSDGEDCGWITAAVWTPKLESLGDYVNCPTLEFSSSGNSKWQGDKAISHDGIASLRSGAIGDGEVSTLETEVEGAGRIGFWWKVSSEAYRTFKIDYISFSIDDVEQAWMGGEIGWTNVAFDVVGSGTHTLRWEYRKDDWEDTKSGEDCAWLDEVVWTPKNDDVAYVAVPDEKAEVVASDGRYVVTAKGDEELTEGDFTFGVVAKEAYKIEIAPDGKSATVTLAAPEIAVATEQEADDGDPSGLLADVDEGAISAKPEPEAGETLGALPVKTYEGLYYQASWGDDLGDMTTGEKVQATGEKLYLGVIKQTGDKGFYKISVSEE